MSPGTKSRFFAIPLSVACLLAGHSQAQALAVAGTPASTGPAPHVPSQNRVSKPTRSHKQARVPVSQLAQQLAASSVQVRLAALKGLAEWGGQASPAVPAIINLLNDNRASGFGSFSTVVSPQITDQILATLKSIGHPAKDAAPYLISMLTDRNELFRRDKVLETLLSTGLDDSGTKTIILMVGEEGKLTNTRLMAIKLLGMIDPPAGEARDTLKDIIGDRNDIPSRKQAMDALKMLEDREAEIEAASKNKKPQENEAAAQIKELRHRLNDAADKEAKIEVLQKIGNLGEKAAPMAPYLVPILTDPATEHNVRLQTAKTLGFIGQSASAALPGLISTLMEEKNELDRGEICRSITSVDPDGTRSIPLIMPALEDPFRARVAIELLDEIGTGESTTLSQHVRNRWRIK